MPDYLQDLIDRSQAYQDPATYPIDTSAPAPWDDQTLKKKKTRAAGESIFGDIPSSPNRAGGNQWLPPGVQPSTTVGPAIAQAAGAVRDWFANPANPSYGASPMSVGAPPQQQGVPDLTAQQPVPFQNVPGLPQGFPGQTSREVDGQPAAGAEKFTPTQKPAVPYQEGGGLPPPIRARPPPPPRSAVMDTSDQTVAGQAGQQAGMLGPLGNIGNWLGQHSNALLAMGAGLMGAPNVWQGLGRGFSYMGPAAQQDIKMQTLMGGQNAAYQALRTAGVPDDLARLGSTDKDVMKQLMEEYFTGKTQSVNVKLPNGTEVTAQYDPHRGTYTDIYGRPFDPNQPGMGGSLIDPSLTGEAARAEAERSVDPATYRRAMGYVSGNLPWPVGRAMTDPRNKQATDLALQIDPNLAQASGQLRNQTILDYGPKGKTGQTRLALSNMMGHAEQLDKLNEIIGNWDAGGERANRARDALKTLLGTDKTYLDAKAQAELLRTVLGGEANKAFSGSHSVTGTEEMIKALGTDKGHTAQHGAIKGMIHAAGTRLGELQSQFDSSMNTKSEGYHMLSPKAQKIFRKWEGDAGMDWDAKAPANLPEGTDAAEAFAPIAGAKAAPAVQGTAGPANLPHVKTPAEAQALPSNTRFIDPNGVERIRP